MSDKLTVKGILSCPIHRHTPSGVTTPSHYQLPASIRVVCKGEGEDARCTATLDDCPSGVFEGDPIPAKPIRFSVKKLRPTESISRGQDRSGGWNTIISWSGEWGWDRNNRVREEFSIHVWDDQPSSNDRPLVFYSGHFFARPYPRAEKTYQREGHHLETTDAERAKLVGVFENAIRRQRYLSRHGGLSPEELEKAPPIRLGGKTLDWRQQTLGRRRKAA